MMLAVRCGVPDVDKLANSLTESQWQEWLAFALLDGWFHNVWQHEEPKKTSMNADQAKAYFASKY